MKMARTKAQREAYSKLCSERMKAWHARRRAAKALVGITSKYLPLAASPAPMVPVKEFALITFGPEQYMIRFGSNGKMSDVFKL